MTSLRDIELVASANRRLAALEERLAPLLSPDWTPDEAGLAALPERARELFSYFQHEAAMWPAREARMEEEHAAQLAEKEAQLAEAHGALEAAASHFWGEDWRRLDHRSAGNAKLHELICSALSGPALARAAEEDRLRREVCEAAEAEAHRSGPLLAAALMRLRAAREKGEGNAEAEG